MADLFDLDKIHSTNNLDRWYKESWMALNMGAGEWTPDFVENMNDQAGTETSQIAGRDFSDGALGLTEYWVDTQEIRQKAVTRLLFTYIFANNAFDLDQWGDAAPLTNGWSIFWDRTFNIGTNDSPIPFVVRLFETNPIRDNQEFREFFGINFNNDEYVQGQPDVQFAEGVFPFKVPLRLRNLTGEDFTSDRIGITLNDNYNLGSGLTSFKVQVEGFSIFNNRRLL